MRGFWAEQLSAEYAARYVVSLQPDLPTVLEGPDLMVAKRGRLFAFFEPTAREKRMPVRILAVYCFLAWLCLITFERSCYSTTPSSTPVSGATYTHSSITLRPVESPATQLSDGRASPKLIQ